MDAFTATALETEIRGVLTNEPRINVISVDIVPNFENNEFNVTLVYDIIGIDVPPQQLNVALVSAR
jgi:hypothetical protein